MKRIRKFRSAFRSAVISRKSSPSVDGLLSLSKKSSNGWAFSYLDGIINMGDERCWNAEKWIAES